MQVYLDLLRQILDKGLKKSDRTGIGTFSIFGHQMRFNLSEGFPLITTKRLHIKSIVHELLWFLRGETNIRELQAKGVHIWDNWANSEGELGPIYGRQWRAWPDENGQALDQLTEVIETIQRDPNSRRLVVSAWNVAELPKMALAPCHVLFQFYIANNTLSCHLYQRSADCFLGLPFNIASYALLTHLVAHLCGLKVGDLIWSGGDCHLYLNHLNQVREQLTRIPYPLPHLLILKKPLCIEDYLFEDIEFQNYQSHPIIKGTVAV